MSLIRDSIIKDIEENGDLLVISRDGMTDYELRAHRKMVIAGKIHAPTVRELGCDLINIIDRLEEITSDIK